MKRTLLIRISLCCLLLSCTAGQLTAQSQACPININFANGDLSNWSAATGLVGRTGIDYPFPNAGVSTIPEYTLGITGIQVITTPGTDPFGSFITIPTINGYSYGYSIKLGSTATSYELNAGRAPGGFVRSVSYNILVPAGPASEPYTMTYAYAMVLENGTHNSHEQPLFKATLSTPDSIVTCASPEYYLPTFNNAGSGGGGGAGTGATLDSATAIANGFTNSPTPFLSHSGGGGGGGGGGGEGQYLYDVWTKGWTEVTFDLSAYRGRQVTLTFTAENCNPGAHFAYAYVAVRNSCAGLEISGPQTACANMPFTYSIPALANATYNWQVPSGWTIQSGGNTNSIVVKAGSTTGYIIARELNGCADLRDTILVTSKAPTIAGNVTGDNQVCTGINVSPLTLGPHQGDILQWLSSTDGISWTPVPNTSNTFNAQNLTATTHYAAIVQNGNTCSADTSTAALIIVDPKSVGGRIDPANSSFCIGQPANALLTLHNQTGAVQAWQLSTDARTWAPSAPAITASTYTAGSITQDSWYRAVVKSGVCPADTSAMAVIRYVNVPFPAAIHNPEDAVVCYGDSILLNAMVSIGTNYSWKPLSTLSNMGNGRLTTLPAAIQATAKPQRNTDYVLTILNQGCPNALNDTFRIAVADRIIVNAGSDTSVVIGQPLQLQATANDPRASTFSWTPGTWLNHPDIANPIALFNGERAQSITYTVKATRNDGCSATDNINVKLFYTNPEIFVPNAFTPNGDGNNDVIRPICVGISQLRFFRIYNRFGQMVYATTEINKGWDGMLGGQRQSSGTFAYLVQGTDYTGRVITKRGTVQLLR
ncbi:gliding motility-associated C-terminal domain-containing protein [Paraflavitalea pollutisoli]|uniref:T9SS type B sorting domain-containing protein n=1 Tax=Paraflavitalea pollutisoli TaxID=3034143 RepID=UPI0023EB4FE8|nr:gliding motility-associated C-terminal domain-containing protein [Paraflavitalea sp. H1-2-19X]